MPPSHPAADADVNRCFLPLSYNDVTPSPQNAEAVVDISHGLHPRRSACHRTEHDPPRQGALAEVAHARPMALSRSARAVASEGPYQVSSRPETSTTRWAGNSSGPSSAVNG